MQVTLSWYTIVDLDQARKFYAEVPGLQQIYEMPGWGGVRRCQRRAGDRAGGKEPGRRTAG